MINKKSQIQIGETIAVLFVFFILAAIGFVFYASTIKSNLESESEELMELKSIQIVQKITSMPELQCSKDVIKEDLNCIDMLKLDENAAIRVISENQAYYFDIFGFGEISIVEIYPGDRQFKVYSNVIQDYKSKFVTNLPVSLYDTVEKKHRFGVLTIVVFSRD